MKTIKIYNSTETFIFVDNRGAEPTLFKQLDNESRKKASKAIIDHIEKHKCDLAKYMHNDDVKSITTSIEIKDNKIFGVATCEVADDFNSIGELKEYLQGQYSDGWGEEIEECIQCGDFAVKISFWTFENLMTEEEFRR